MGLDVYLYRYNEDVDKAKALEEEGQKVSDEAWDKALAGRKYEDLTPAERDTLRLEVETACVARGFDKYGDVADEVRQQIEAPSAKYPDHYFKVGYFRSSYNESGINRKLGNRGLGSLAAICGIDPDEYVVQPDWTATKERALAAADKLKTETFDVVEKSANQFMGPEQFVHGPNEALEAYRAELAKNHHMDGAYENGKGAFYMDEPLKVRGVIQGLKTPFFGNEALLPAVYLIVEQDFSWYVQALEIVAETCDYVLSQPDPERYRLHWSG